MRAFGTPVIVVRDLPILGSIPSASGSTCRQPADPLRQRSDQAYSGRRHPDAWRWHQVKLHDWSGATVVREISEPGIYVVTPATRIR